MVGVNEGIDLRCGHTRRLVAELRRHLPSVHTRGSHVSCETVAYGVGDDAIIEGECATRIAPSVFRYPADVCRY